MKKSYMNPYMAGTMLGIVLLLAMFLSGRGLGASGGIKYCVVSVVGAIDPAHAESSVFYSKYFEGGKNPLKNWLTFEILGVVAGGFLSGALSKRLKFKLEKAPGISNNRRLIFAFLGGLFFVYGAQLARGCTSGAALLGDGSPFCCRLCNYDRDLWISIRFRVVFQEELDIDGAGHRAQCAGQEAQGTEIKTKDKSKEIKVKNMGPISSLITMPEWLDFLIALLIGIGFGFSLEQAGFSSSRKLVGMFYGYDTTVVKVFFTAAIVALIGSQLLSYFGLLNLNLVFVNEFYVTSSIVGGVIMGAGFIMGGYCPGTGLSALSIGKIDAMAFFAGGLTGAFLFGETFPLVQNLANSSYKGPVKINEVLGLSPGIFIFLLIIAAVAMFWIAEVAEKRFARPDITNSI